MAQSDETMFPAAADNLDQSSNWMVGVIDDPQQAEQAQRDLVQAGFPQDGVLLLHGQEALQRMRAKDEQRGPLGWVHKAVASIATDASAFQDNYADEANAGHTIVNVHVSEQDQMERARQILVAHNAHYIKHFGTWVVSDLS